MLDPNEVKQQLASDPQFIRDGYAEYQKVLSQAQNQHNLSDGYSQTKMVTQLMHVMAHVVEQVQKQPVVQVDHNKRLTKWAKASSLSKRPRHMNMFLKMHCSGNTIYFANGQMITFPEGTNMEEKVKEYANYDMISNVEKPKQK